MDELVSALAVFRITRLIVEDTLFDDQRAALIDWLKAHDHPKVAYLITCPWCSSMYVAAAVVIVARYRWWRPLARVLAASAAAGLLSDR